MTPQELKRLVAKGESDRLEFKHTTAQRTHAAQTICAMLKYTKKITDANKQRIDEQRKRIYSGPKLHSGASPAARKSRLRYHGCGKNKQYVNSYYFSRAHEKAGEKVGTLIGVPLHRAKSHKIFSTKVV
jgi:hypothetical protein